MRSGSPRGLMPSPVEWQRHRARAYILCYPWIPAFAGMMDEEYPARVRSGKCDRLDGLGIRLQGLFVIRDKRAAPLRVEQSEKRCQNTRATSHTASAAKVNQTTTTTTAATLLTGLSFALRAFSRHSASTGGGIILIASATPSGMRIRSSKYPRTGTGSGMRSMGLKAYPTTTAAKTRAYQGTLGSL